MASRLPFSDITTIGARHPRNGNYQYGPPALEGHALRGTGHGSRPTLPWLTITKSAVRASSWGLFLAHNSILAILSAYKYGHRTVRHNTMGLTAEHEPHQPPMAMR